MLGRGRECSRRLIASNLQSTIRDLQRRKARGRRGLALIEGVRLVEEELGAGVFAELADTETPQGIIAVIEPRRWSAGDFTPSPGAVALVIDGVQDPGNVGTL